MCGIAGCWQSKRGSEEPLETLRRMGSALIHRGPDDSGEFHDSATGVGLAFRRLSILDLSPEGHQPMFSASGRWVIVFNGEVYNFEEIRSELGPRGWRGRSDTEVMLEAIECWGVEAAVRRFVGMFAFAVWDRQQGRLYLVRDRLGIKPLYYGHVDGAFVFGSELKSIRAYPNFQGEVDRDALALYMRHNYVPSPHCIYKGIRKLQPGSLLMLGAATDEPVISTFWSGREAAKAGLESCFEGSDEEAIDQLESKLLTGVRLRMISDVPLGAFLSGGVDSSTVVALMQAQSNRPVKTFSIGFRDSGYNEAAHAKEIAAHLGTEHTELYVAPSDAQAVIPLLATMYDEPFADSSQIPTYLVSKLARTKVTVSLSGDGGDELFGGYNRYLLTASLANFGRRTPRALRRSLAGLIHSVPPAWIDGVYGCFRPLLPRNKRWLAVGESAHKLADFFECEGAEAIYLRALSHWAEPSSVIPGSNEPATVSDFSKDSAWLPRIEELMMLTDLVNYLPDDILTKVDRASMAVSLEARVPLLDHRVVEFCWRLPLHLKIRQGSSKWALRQVLYKYVPRELIERPKMGFNIPIGNWLKGPLREWAEDLLSEAKLRQHGLFHVSAIRGKWREHLSGARNRRYLLWDVLMFQEWFYNGRHSVR